MHNYTNLGYPCLMVLIWTHDLVYEACGWKCVSSQLEKFKPALIPTYTNMHTSIHTVAIIDPLLMQSYSTQCCSYILSILQIRISVGFKSSCASNCALIKPHAAFQHSRNGLHINSFTVVSRQVVFPHRRQHNMKCYFLESKIFVCPDINIWLHKTTSHKINSNTCELYESAVITYLKITFFSW